MNIIDNIKFYRAMSSINAGPNINEYIIATASVVAISFIFNPLVGIFAGIAIAFYYRNKYDKINNENKEE